MILRRIRGILTTAAIWSVSWGLVGTVFTLVLRTLGHVDPEATPVHELLVYALAVFGTLGAIGGALFALLVITVGRSHIDRRVSPWVAALAGLVPSAIVTRAVLPQPSVVFAFGLLGGLLAAVSVWAAQRAQAPTVPDREAATQRTLS